MQNSFIIIFFIFIHFLILFPRETHEHNTLKYHEASFAEEIKGNSEKKTYFSAPFMWNTYTKQQKMIIKQSDIFITILL